MPRAAGIWADRAEARAYAVASVALPDDSDDAIEALTDDLIAGPRDAARPER